MPKFDSTPGFLWLVSEGNGGRHACVARAMPIYRYFGGIDPQSDAGWAKIKGALRRLSGDLPGGEGHASSTPRRRITQEPNR